VSERRRYERRPKRVKLAAVMAAEAAGVTEASRQTGIPHQTIAYWLQNPEFAEIRRKTREDLAEEYRVAAHVTIARLVELAPTMEARDVIFAAEKAASMLQLLSGAATMRAEISDVTAVLDDHETAQLSDAVQALLESAK